MSEEMHFGEKCAAESTQRVFAMGKRRGAVLLRDPDLCVGIFSVGQGVLTDDNDDPKEVKAHEENPFCPAGSRDAGFAHRIR